MSMGHRFVNLKSILESVAKDFTDSEMKEISLQDAV